MLYSIFDFLENAYGTSGAQLFKFITFRTGAAVIVSLIISMLFGGKIIDYLRRLQVGESIRDLGLAGQKEKEGTPTMGGIIIIMAILIPCLLFARLDNIYIIIMLVSTVWMAAIGFVDDYIKVFKKDKEGLSGKFKILGQVVLGLIIAVTMLAHEEIVVYLTDADLAGKENIEIIDTQVIKGQTYYVAKTALTNVPFFKNNEVNYGNFLNFLGLNSGYLTWLIFIPFVIFIVTAVSNGANLTDGIDGLAAGVSAIVGAVLAVFAYLSSNIIFAEYLNILYLPNVEELVIFCGCFVGACLGFLWYNSFPAKVFMGDTGSLTLGGIIAALAILIRKELLIPLMCGVFLIETLSVMIQVSYFKYSRKKYGEGRRVFLMSPLHHHFQKKGMHESKIVTRFWIIGILLAALTIITLKIR